MKFKIFLLALLILFLAWSAFQPDGFLVTIQHNFWSLKLVNSILPTVDKQKQVSLPPTIPHSAVLLARQAIREQQFQYAEEILTPLLPYQDRTVQGTYAEVLYSNGQKTEAFKMWEKFNETIILERAANQLSQEGDEQNLLEAHRALYRLDPEKYTSGLGFTLKAQGQVAEAEQVLLSSRAEYPNSQYRSDWLRYLADISTAKGDWQQAEEIFLQTIQENDHDGKAWRNLGYLYLNHLNMPEKAVECFQQLILLSPGETYGYSLLAESYEKAGNIEKALQTYQNLLLLNPDDASALEAMDRLMSEENLNP